jgi:hypothetical protein
MSIQASFGTRIMVILTEIEEKILPGCCASSQDVLRFISEVVTSMALTILKSLSFK